MAKKNIKHSRVGLSSDGRIDWNAKENLSCFALAQFSPFYASVIGSQCGGLTRQQIYERCKQFGGGLRSIRNGQSPIAKIIIDKYSVSTMKSSVAKELQANLNTLVKK